MEIKRYQWRSKPVRPVTLPARPDHPSRRQGSSRIPPFRYSRPLFNQLPALWLSAFAVLAGLGSGAFVRFLAAGEFTSLLAWLAGALFIPSLALALGVLTGSGKAFEVVYVLWIYGALQRVPAFDFVGTTPASPWYFYAPLALALITISILFRQWQLKSG